MSIRNARGADLWRLEIIVTETAAIGAASIALETVARAVSAFEITEGGDWRVEALTEDKPDRALAEAALTLAWTGREGPPPDLTIEQIPARDWVAENQASFKPLEVGRFFVHGSHYADQVPTGRVGLLIDAATAFGTGEHATTRGCLLALDGLAKRSVRPRRILDMGTGTGILALAAAKIWHRPVVARDIDPESVRVTKVNAHRNGVAAWIAAETGAGYKDRLLRRRRPYDLVFANILARPLMAMAPDLARALAPGGVAILSGLLARHEAAVLAAHRVQGLVLRRRIDIDGWHTLVIARGGAPHSAAE